MGYVCTNLPSLIYQPRVLILIMVRQVYDAINPSGQVDELYLPDHMLNMDHPDAVFLDPDSVRTDASYGPTRSESVHVYPDDNLIGSFALPFGSVEFVPDTLYDLAEEARAVQAQIDANNMYLRPTMSELENLRRIRSRGGVEIPDYLSSPATLIEERFYEPQYSYDYLNNSDSKRHITHRGL